MENKIIVTMQPFDIYQKIFVVNENNEVVHNTYATVTNLNNIIKSLSSEYNATNISLKGSTDYLLKFQEQLLTDYANLNVNIIE